MKLNGNLCSWATLIGGFVLIAGLAYLLYGPSPYYYRQLEAHIETPGPYVPGQTIWISRTYCVNIRFSKVDTYLYDNNRRVYPNVSREFVEEHPPCPTTSIYPVHLPLGDYTELHFHGSHRIWENFLRDDIVTTPEILIPITKGP